VIILSAALLLGRWALVPVLWFLAAATLATTVQRIVHVAAKLPGGGARIPGAGTRPQDRPDDLEDER
jgi:hypothetical protein